MSTNLHLLSDRELLLHADNQDPLLTSDLEIELRERFAKLVGLAETFDLIERFDMDVSDEPTRKNLEKVFEDYSVGDLAAIVGVLTANDTPDAKNLESQFALVDLLSSRQIADSDDLKVALDCIDVLQEHDVDAPDALKSRLAIADEAEALVLNAGNTLIRLNSLISPIIKQE